MKSFTRRNFIITCAGGLFLQGKRSEDGIMTITGKIPASALGLSLVHEHFLVDFIGADKISYDRWNRNDVVKKVLPYLIEAKEHGVKTIFDCTPAYLGRDVQLLTMLTEQSGVQIVTNTGFYGAVQNKYLPPVAFSHSAEDLATIWTKEFQSGIEGSSVKPGFIKISVDSGGSSLSAIHQKLVKAAALTHLRTGLTIFSHTGPAPAAFQQLDILTKAGAHPSSFVWVHAQSEKDRSQHLAAAAKGAWVSLDGIGWGGIEDYADSLVNLRTAGLLNRVLISHDAGWFKPEDPSAAFKGFTNIFTGLFPLLEKKGFSKQDFTQLLITNPAEAMRIRVRT